MTAEQQDRGDIILKRADESFRWYNDKAGRSMRSHYFWSTTVLVAAGLVPIFALSPGEIPKYIAAGLGALAGIARGVEALRKYYDHYTDYRSTAEALHREKYEYETRLNAYTGLNDEDAITHLGSRGEEITSKAEQRWQMLQDRGSGVSNQT